jgi:hypothetical protein
VPKLTKEIARNEELKQYSSMILFVIVLDVVYDHMSDVNGDISE